MPFIAAGSCEPLRVWSRLEPRTRQVDFADSLAARVHDPMFMLARQWQFGEFAGEDGGSAVLATIARRVTPVRGTEPDADLGLEPGIERLPVDFPLLVRARLGRSVLARLDAAAEVAGTINPSYDPSLYRALFRDAFGPLDAEPTEPLDRARDRAAPRAQRVRQALRGKAVDGVRVFTALHEGMMAADLPAGFAAAIAPGHLTLVLSVLEDYRRWFADTYGVPGSGGLSWRPGQLEYGATLTAARNAGTDELRLDEHVGTRMDWYSFDQGGLTSGTASASTTDVRTVIPTPAEFPGMPKPRWWQLEDAAVDLGKLRADTTDAARIVVSEFALLYGNNWFVLPCSQPVGTLAEVDAVVVTDVFGWRTLISAPATRTGTWADWDLFSLSPRGSAAPTVPLPQHLFIPATLTHLQQADPHESVVMVRDETADLVWAVEQRVPDGLGGSREGADAARRLRQQLQPDPVVPPSDAPALRYVAQTEVAENWIPFLPVHVDGGLRAIRLQRGAIRRTVPPVGSLIRPVTSILRHGVVDDSGSAPPYFVDEEEVPRAGVVVTGVLRRARRFDGVPVVWHARTIGSGRGGGDSGLVFDRVEERRP